MQKQTGAMNRSDLFFFCMKYYCLNILRRFHWAYWMRAIL